MHENNENKYDFQFTISTIKGKGMTSTYLNFNNKTIFFVSHIKIRNKFLPPAFGIGTNPNFFYNATIQEKELSLSDLKENFVEIYISELDKINSIQIKEKANSLNENDNSLSLFNKGVFYSGIKIDLFSIVFGPEFFDFPLFRKSDPKQEEKIAGRISFRIKCDQLKPYKISIMNLTIQKTAKKEQKIKANITLETSKSKRYIGNTISLKLNESGKESLEITAINSTCEDIYESTLDISLYNNQEDIIAHCSLSEIKDKLLFTAFSYLVNRELKRQESYTLTNIKLPLFIEEEEQCEIIFDISISNFPFVIQKKNCFLTEKGVMNNVICLYPYLPYCDQEKKFCHFNIHETLNVAYNNIKDITDKMKNKNSVIKKYLSTIRGELSKSIDNDIQLFKYETKSELRLIVSVLFRLTKELVRLIEISNDDSNLIMNILDTLRVIFKRGEMNGDIIEMMFEKDDGESDQKKYDKIKEILSKEYIEYIQSIILLGTLIKNKLPETKSFSLTEIYAGLFYKLEYIKNMISSLMTEEKTLENENILFKHTFNCIKNQELLTSSTEILNQKNPNERFPNLSSHKTIYLSLLKNIIAANSGKYSFPFVPSSFDVVPSLIKSFSSLLTSPQFLYQNAFYINEIISLLLTESSIINQILNNILLSTNAYDTRSVYTTIDFIHSIINKGKTKINWYLIQTAEKAIFSLENSLNITKMLWLYYCDAHMMELNHVQWFINNIVKNNYYSFAFHWSWKVRMMFYKTIVYIFEFRLGINNICVDFSLNARNQNEKIGQILKEKVKINTCEVEVGIKEYNSVIRELSQWSEGNKKKTFVEYPVILINLPKEDDCS